MKKIYALAASVSLSALLGACGGFNLPDCQADVLDGCGRGSAYTEERTAWPDPAPMPEPTPEPVVVPAPEPAYTPPPAPEPEPEPVREPVVEPITKPADPVFDDRLRK